MICPPRLTRLYGAMIATEVTHHFEHGMNNVAAAIGGAIYHVKRQVLKDAALGKDPVIREMFGEMEGRLKEGVRPPPTLLAPPGADLAAVDLGAMFRGLRAELGPSERARVELVAADGLAVRGVRDELELALCCLIENALEGTGPAGAARVEVRARVAAGALVIEVTDDGPGLPPSVRPRSFDRFASTKPGRLGVGLAIVRRIALRAGGRLALETPDTGGVIARLELKPAPVESAVERRPRVLVVDDDDGIRLTLEALLDDIGCDPILVESIAAGRLALAGGGFSLAILDLNLGDGRGTELIDLARSAGARTMLLTGSGSPDEDSVGADAVILKGTEPEEVLAKVAALLSASPR